MKKIFLTIYVFAFGIFLNESLQAQAYIDLETGAIFPGYNDVRIPGDTGTFFSLSEDLTTNSQVFYRLRAGYTINDRHTISVLYAPLETTSTGRIANDIVFDDAVFTANTELNGTYKFNSYRLTYRYRIVDNPKFLFGLGLTGKIRDANIGLSSNTMTAEKTNVGFVPLINFRLWYKFNDTFGILLDGDALAAPQGRAEDVQLAATYALSDAFNIRAGYRILEGGADNDEVYNFTLIHYVSLGLRYTFGK